MKRLWRSALSISVLAAGVLTLTVCENPFRAGLGPLLDMEVPTITLTSPATGTFVQGNQQFHGRVGDDLKVENAWFVVASHPEPRDDLAPEDLERLAALGEWQKLELNLSAGGRDGTWEYFLPTNLFRDGLLGIRLRVRDGAGFETETAKFVFQITNLPPRVSLSQPLVIHGSGPGELGGPALNFGFAENPPFSFPNLDRGVVADARRVQGLIADYQGVYLGAVVDNRFPPQFRFWEISTAQYSERVDGVPVFPAEVVPTESQLPWQNLGDAGSRLFDADITGVRFHIDFPVNPEGRIFAVQVRAQSVRDPGAGGDFGTFTFPRDSWSDPEWEALDPERRVENSFVAFRVRSPQEPPGLDLWGLEDVFGPGAWNGGKGRYGKIPGLGGGVPNPFLVSRVRNDKSGPFTLRVRTWHEGGVDEAMAFWVASDGSRGRFIWDLADTPPYPEWNGENVSTDLPFALWGFGDPNLTPLSRNFVFTWGYNVPAKIPDTPAFDGSGVRNRSRIQIFDGDIDNWNRMFGDLEDYWLELQNPADSGWWKDHTFDGVQDNFEISIYARTAEGTVSGRLTTILTIDATAPNVAVTEISGSPWRDENGVDVVNGVIRAHIHAYDSRPTDTDLRNSHGYFERPAGTPGAGNPSREVMFILVRDTEAHLVFPYLDGLTHPWPLYADMPVNIPGVEILQHGPVFDGSMLIQTSPVYDGQADYLPDGLYRLFVFARDNAFNIGRLDYPLRVEKDSDLPRFDFSIGLMTDAVTDPNLSADDTENGFRGPGGGVRNRLRPGNDIAFMISDDDSLDLRPSPPGEAFGIRLGFTGFRSDPGGNPVITPHEHVIWFAPETVSAIFTPQPVENGARQPVFERVGNIEELLLLNLLRQPGENLENYRHLFRDDPAVYNRLPDGVYRVSVIVHDDYSNKLVMPGQTVEPRNAISRETHFWVAVDNQPPLLDPLAVLPPNESPIASAETVHVQGLVSDENGPIRVRRFTVAVGDGLVVRHGVTGAAPPPGFTIGLTNPNPGNPNSMELDTGDVLLVRTPRTDIWQHSFAAPININGMFILPPGGYEITQGTFHFELVFEDRFGGDFILTRTFSVDHEPPVLSVTRPVAVFERPSAADRLPADSVGVVNPGSPGAAPVNARRLANRVIDFSVHAVDAYSGVAGIRWWLLPANVGSPVPADALSVGALVSQPGGGTVDSFGSYPARSFVNPDDIYGAVPPTAIPPVFGTGVRGAFGQIAFGGQVSIDAYALGLPDGEYRLHVIAMDGAGNESRLVAGGEGGNVMQTIFLFDDEDRPYFHGINLQEDAAGNRPVVTADGLVIQGIVMDDDGFGLGMTIHPDTLRVWYSYDPEAGNAADEKLTADDLDASPYWHGGQVVTQGVSLSGRNLNLNINLRQIFPEHFNAPDLSDGLRYIVIRAQDAPVNKLASDIRPGADTERRERYAYFSFMLDTSPPEVVLDSPEPEYRAGNVPFAVTGSIRDANLELVPIAPNARNVYGLRWSVVSEDGNFSGIFTLDPESGYVTSTLLPDGTTLVVFDLPPAFVANVFANTPGSRPGAGGSAVHYSGFTFDPDAQAANPSLALLGERSHQFELEARDAGGLSAVIARGFVIDRNGPSGTINFPDFTVWYPFPADFDSYHVTMPEDVFRWWLDPAAMTNTGGATGDALVRLWHNRKREWAAGFTHDAAQNPDYRTRNLPVVFRDGAVATLNGSFADSISAVEISTLRFRINGRDAFLPTPDGAGGTSVRWALPLAGANGNSLPDGVHVLEIRVGDAAGNYTEMGPFAFRLDSARAESGFDYERMPANSVFASAAGFAGSNVFTLRGAATDANLRDIRLEITESGMQLPIIGINLVAVHNDPAHPYNSSVALDWSYDDSGVPTLDWAFTLSAPVYAANFVRDGSFEVNVVATDWNNPASPNSRSEPASWVFVRDTASPVVTFDSGLVPTAADYTPENLFFVENILAASRVVNRFHLDGQAVTGIATDNHGVYRIQVRLEEWDWESGGWIEYRDWDDRPVVLTGTSDNRVWRVPLRGGTAENGRLDIDDGLYRIRIRAMDFAWFANGNPDFGPGDLGNPVTLSQWVYFYFDRMSPQIVEVDPQHTMSSRHGTNAAGDSGYLSFLVDATDENRLHDFSATVTGVAGASVSLDANQLGALSGARLRLDLPVPETLNGRFALTLTATDFAGRTSTVTRNIDLDNVSPGILITSLHQPEMMVINNVVSTGAFLLIAGEAHDIAGPVDSLPERVYFRVGTIFDGTSHTMPTPDLLAQKYAGVQAERDTAGNNPAFDGFVDNPDSAWFRLDQTGANVPQAPLHFTVPSRNLFNWQLRVNDLSVFADPVALKPGGSAEPRVMGPSRMPVLPISFRVVDGVGNAGYFVLSLTIDMDAELPRTSIETPREDGNPDQPMGGAITIDGVASTSAPLDAHSVLLRVSVGKNSDDSLTVVSLPMDPVTTGDFPVEFVESQLENSAYWKSGEWFPATLLAPGQIAPWFFLLNAGGELTERIGDLGHNGLLYVKTEVLAVNKDGSGVPYRISGSPTVRTFYIRDSAPEIRNVEVEDRFGTRRATGLGEPLGGRFTVSAVLDASEGPLRDVRIARPGESGFVTVWPPGPGTETLPGLTLTPSAGNRIVSLTYVLDSTLAADVDPADPAYPSGVGAVRNGAWANAGGRFQLEILIRDNTIPPAVERRTITVDVDNSAPAVDVSFHANPRQAGTAGVFQGSVLDNQGFAGTANIPEANLNRNVDKVYAWFTDRNGFVPFDGNQAGRPGAVSRNVMQNREFRNGHWEAGAAAAIDSPPLPVSSDNWVTVLRHGAPGGYLWLESNGGRNVEWQFTLNTTLLPSGPVTLHYIAVDRAGNMTYGNQGIVIMNNSPELNDVMLFTANSDVPAVINWWDPFAMDSPDPNDPLATVMPGTFHRLNLNQTPAERARGYIESGFTVKNSFLGLRVEALFGNDFMNYRLQHVTRRLVTLDRAGMAGILDEGIALVTIAARGNVNDAEWNRLGVTVDPSPGTHFVFDPREPSTGKELDVWNPDHFRGDMTGQVWVYTAVGGEKNVSNAAINRPIGPNPGTPPPDFPSGAGFYFTPGDDFNFAGHGPDGHFAPRYGAGIGRIPEYIRDTGIALPLNPNPAPAVDVSPVPNPADMLQQSTNGRHWNYRDRPFFLLRAWDNVNPGNGENTQLSDALVIGMNISLYDWYTPLARIYDFNPYMVTPSADNMELVATIADALNPRPDPDALPLNILRGGLFNTGTQRNPRLSGHVEPRLGSMALQPIGSNGASVGNTTSARPLAHGFVSGDTTTHDFSFERDRVSGQVILRGRVWDNSRIQDIQLWVGYGDWQTILVWDNNTQGMIRGPGFDENRVGVAEIMDWSGGHTVEWSFLWNTEELSPSGLTEDVRIIVRARDFENPAFWSGGPDGIPSDASGVSRPAQPAGFFDSVSADIVPYVTGLVRGEPYRTLRSMQGWYSFYRGETGITVRGFNLGGSPQVFIPAESGRIDVNATDGTPIHNHKSNPALSWNKENFDAVPESGLWNNRLHAHIWHTAETVTNPATGASTLPPTFMGPFANSEGLTHPGMTINASGELIGTWNVFGTANVHFGMNNAPGVNTRTNVVSGIPVEPHVTPDVSEAGYIVMVHQADGNPAVWRVDVRNGLSGTATPSNVQLISGGGGPTLRWRNPRIHGTTATVHDAFAQNLRVVSASGSVAGAPIVGGAAETGPGVGLFSAIGPGTVAYFHGVRDTVRIATGSAWATPRDVLPAGHPLFSGSGQYVSMAVSGSDIHLAFFNSRLGAVVYAFSDNGGLSFEAVVVDTLRGVGTWTDISLDAEGNPWIVYGFQDRAGNYDGVRMAFRTRNHAVEFSREHRCPVTGGEITGWEAVSMPAPFRVNNDRLNIETSRGSVSWDTAIGYASDRFRIGYFFRPETIGENTGMARN